uniref:CCHC-type domain-containing protein n=1 Tax=Tanacetum cinerariifolium TaxID=118510 RepID=A0A6L2ND73_TANCI|nr:hypothetical protein [Tanacetum cinerariifolium]
MYEEYFEKKYFDVSINSIAQQVHNHEDSHSTSSIIIEKHKAPPIVTTSEDQTSSISLNEADEFNQEDSVDFDGNTVFVPYDAPNFEEADSSKTALDPSNIHELYQSQYVIKLLKKHGMDECVSMSTPMATKRLDDNLQDADHAGCKDDCKSTSGGIQFLVIWRRTQLLDYGYKYNKIPMYCNSKSVIAISCNTVQHSRTKHINIRYHFNKEHVERGTVELYFVGTEYQLADLFTKALLKDCFEYLVYHIERAKHKREYDRRMSDKMMQSVEGNDDSSKALDDGLVVTESNETELERERAASVATYARQCKGKLHERTKHKREYERRMSDKMMQSVEGNADSSKALDDSLVVTESNETESERYVLSSRSRNDTHTDDADINSMNDKQPMAEISHSTPLHPHNTYHSPIISSQPQAEFPQLDSGLVALVFLPGYNLIAYLNKSMAFTKTVVALHFPSINNQLRTSSNPKKPTTIQNGGNNTTGKARVVKCYNCQGKGHMARQCTQPKIPRNAAWFTV